MPTILHKRRWDGGKPDWPYTVNEDSPQALQLVGWYTFEGSDREVVGLRGPTMQRYSGTSTSTSAPTWSYDPTMGQVTNHTASPVTSFRGTPPTAALALPMSMACWFTSTNVTALQHLMYSGAYNQNVVLHRLSAGGATTGDPILASSAVAAVSSAQTTTGYVANTWQHACGVWTSTTLRAAYLNGGSKGTETTSRNPGVATWALGTSWANNGVGGGLSGQLADCRFYRRALTDQEVIALYDPETRWELYYPLGRKSWHIFGQTSANTAPVVNAGADQVIAYGASAFLVGTVTDDGGSPGLTYFWTQVSGPGTATFDPDDHRATEVTFSTPGIYVLRLTADDGTLTGSDDVTITASGQAVDLTQYLLEPVTQTPGADTAVTQYLLETLEPTTAPVDLTQWLIEVVEPTPVAVDATQYLIEVLMLRPLYTEEDAYPGEDPCVQDQFEAWLELDL